MGSQAHCPRQRHLGDVLNMHLFLPPSVNLANLVDRGMKDFKAMEMLNEIAVARKCSLTELWYPHICKCDFNPIFLI